MRINERPIREVENIIEFEPLHPRVVKRLKRLIVMLEYEQIDAEDALEEANMYRLRNPEFPGDMVGRPDDDYFDDDDDEDDQKKFM